MNQILKSAVATALRAVNRIRAFTAGYKTWFFLVLCFLYSLGIQYHWLESDQTIWTALGSATVLSVRATVIRIMVKFLDDMTAASATPPQP